MEDITMLRKTRIALTVIAMVTVTVVFTAGSASAGFYREGDLGYFGFGLVL